jgi:hypothetical protein
VGCGANRFGKGVSAEEPRGIPGVNVSVKGTTIGTLTDSEGNYSLAVPQGAETIVFSFVGYATQEIAIANQTSI